MGIFFYLSAVLVFSLLPIYLFRKSYKETFSAGVAIIIFLLIHKDLFLGKVHLFHDTFWSGEAIFYLLRQWMDYGFYPGWNPFMNGGEPVYLFSNLFLRTPFYIFSLLGRFVDIPSHYLFCITWIFMFINFCVGAFLMFCVLFEDFKVAFSCFVCLLFSSFFYTISYDFPSLSITYFLPYILFGILKSVNTRKVSGFLFALIFFGMALNYYVPHYVIIFAIVFLISLFSFKTDSIRMVSQLVRKKAVLFVFALVVTILAASPAIFSAFEYRDFVSPTRGATDPVKGLQINEGGSQVRGYFPLRDYLTLVNADKYDVAISYLGLITILFVAVAIFSKPNVFTKIFGVTTIIMIIFSMGEKGLVLPFLIKIIPIFEPIRHPASFVHIVSFLLVCLFGFGLKIFLYEQDDGKSRSYLGIVFLVSSILCLISNSLRSVIFVIVSFISIWALFFLKKIIRTQKRAIVICFVIVLSILSCDLLVFWLRTIKGYYDKSFYSRAVSYSDAYFRNYSYVSDSLDGTKKKLADFKYPLTRSFYLSVKPYVPPDILPALFKKASLTSRAEDCVFFRDKNLNDMLKLYTMFHGYEVALGVGVPTLYFTSQAVIADNGISNESFIDQIFEANKNTDDRKVFLRSKDIDFTWYNKSMGGISNEATKILVNSGSPNKLDVILYAPSDGFLVRLENFNRHWLAYINGTKTKIYRANHAFQAIKVSAGVNRITFEFNSPYPRLFFIYILVSVLVWLSFNLYLYFSGSDDA